MFTWMTHWWDTICPAQSWRVPPMTAAFLQKDCAAKSQPLDWHQRGQQRAEIFKFHVFLSRKTSTERKVTFCKNTKSLLSFLAFLCESTHKYFHSFELFWHNQKKKSHCPLHLQLSLLTTASVLHQVILQDNRRACLNSLTDRINSGSLVNVT